MPTAERALLHRGGRRGTWGSLGLWHDGAEDYAEACESLARAVGEAAGIRPGERVLSIGCGAGDELLLWARGFGAAEVCGLEHDPLLVAAARQLVQNTPLPPHCSVRVLGGDAAQLGQLALPRGRFDRVVCVDAAYPQSPRAPCLAAAQALLRPGGRQCGPAGGGAEGPAPRFRPGHASDYAETVFQGCGDGMPMLMRRATGGARARAGRAPRCTPTGGARA